MEDAYCFICGNWGDSVRHIKIFISLIIPYKMKNWRELNLILANGGLTNSAILVVDGYNCYSCIMGRRTCQFEIENCICGYDIFGQALLTCIL